MSARCERPNSEGLERTSFRTATTNNAFVIYVYLHSRPSAGNYDVIASFYAPGSFSGGAIYVDENGALRFRDDNADVISAAGSGTIALDTWTKVVIVFSGWTGGGGSVSVYLAGSTSAGLTASAAVAGTIDLEIGHGDSSYTTARYSDASFFNPKYRESAWTATEGSNELDQAAFVTSGLARWLLDDHTDLDDDEGALDLSAVGTLSTGPDDPWGDGAAAQTVTTTAARLTVKTAAPTIVRTRTVTTTAARMTVKTAAPTIVRSVTIAAGAPRTVIKTAAITVTATATINTGSGRATVKAPAPSLVLSTTITAAAARMVVKAPAPTPSGGGSATQTVTAGAPRLVVKTQAITTATTVVIVTTAPKLVVKAGATSVATDRVVQAGSTRIAVKAPATFIQLDRTVQTDSGRLVVKAPATTVIPGAATRTITPARMAIYAPAPTAIGGAVSQQLLVYPLTAPVDAHALDVSVDSHALEALVDSHALEVVIE